MVRVIISGIVAGIVFFFWGFLVHVVIQLHGETIRPVENPDAVQAFVSAEIAETGAYYFPGFPEVDEGMSEEEQKAIWENFTERYEAGPIGMMFINKEGKTAMDPMHFVMGAGIFMLVGLVASLLVAGTSLSLFGRWFFVLGIGSVTVLFGEISMWNWWHMPTDYTMMLVVDHMIGWALAGIAIAAIVKPKPARTAES